MQIPRRVRKAPCLVASMMLACFPTNSPAQTEQDHGASPILEEVLVTATRRNADLKSVPLSVSVLTEEDLQRLGASGFADYARSVAGLSFTDGGTGGEKQTIRGISTDIWIDFNPLTALYVDEVPMTHASGGIGPPFTPDPMLVDIKRVEVLRGPQGTLFGASAMGGVIRVITNGPDPERSEARVGASVMSTEDGETGYGAYGIYNLPLMDNRAALRAVGYFRDPGGYIDNPANEQKDVNDREVFGGRLSGTTDLSESVKLVGRVAYQSRESGGLDKEDLDAERQQFHPLEESIDDEWVNYNLVFDVDLSWASLLSSTSYFDRDVQIQPDLSFLIPIFFGLDNPMRLENVEEVEELVQEFRLVSADGERLNWLAGLYYQDQDQFLGQRFNSPGFDALSGGLASMFNAVDVLETTRQGNQLEQLALYADLSYQVTDKLEFSVGARWYEFDRKYDNESRGILFTRGAISESASSSESGVTPKFSLLYEVSENLSLHGTATKGYRPGGVNSPAGSTNPDCLAALAAQGISVFPDSYESDELWNYEAGMKARWFSGRMRLNATIYHIDWSDMQTSRLLPCGVGIAENVGEAQSDGVELELTLQPLTGLQLSLAGSYTRAELEEDVPNLGGQSGDRVPGVPRYSASLGISYQFPVFNGRNGFINGEYQYVGKSYSDFNRAASIELESFDIANVRLGVNADAWTAALYVNNVFDERGFLFAETGILGESVTATRPRTIGMSVSREF